MKDLSLYNLFESAFLFWKNRSHSDRKILAENTRSVTFAKGHNVHNGLECTGVVFVKSGNLRLHILSEEGKDITLYRLSKGEFCTLSASCVLQSVTFDVFLDAEEKTECIMIAGNPLHELRPASGNILIRRILLKSPAEKFSYLTSNVYGN